MHSYYALELPAEDEFGEEVQSSAHSELLPCGLKEEDLVRDDDEDAADVVGVVSLVALVSMLGRKGNNLRKIITNQNTIQRSQVLSGI